MAQKYAFVLIWSCISVAFCQRGSFAGTRPIGFPELQNKTTTADGLGNRFGEGDGTTQRLPVEALGDRDLVERLSKLPIDKQPFWFINWQALEQHRQNPQTYPQRPSSFNRPVVPNTDSRAGAPNSGTPNSVTPNFGTPISRTPNSNFGVPNSSSGISNTNIVANSNATATNSNSATTASNLPLINRNSDSDESSSQEHSKESEENLNDKKVYQPFNENKYEAKKTKFIRF